MDGNDEKRGTKQPSRRTRTAPPRTEAQLGQALRSVYDQALGESVPDEMLKLLGKLN